ncbi:large ribosomal subunit protein mL46 [Ciona intestinalis]
MNVSKCSSVLHGRLYPCFFNSIKQTKLLKRALTTQPNRSCDLDVETLSANRDPSPWKICAAVCLIRLPILTTELEEIEKKYAELSDLNEYERSVLSDWEVEKNRQANLIRDIESGEKNPEDMDFKVANQDIEEMNELEAQQFNEENETITIEDSDLTNINRQPNETLVMVTQQKLGKDSVWMLPVEAWSKEETLRECAERALISHCGTDVGAAFISNGPSGFYKYKFPKDARENSLVGAKLFIYNAYLPRVFIKDSKFTFPTQLCEDKVLQHAWLTKDELKSFTKPKFTNVIKKILL